MNPIALSPSSPQWSTYRSQSASAQFNTPRFTGKLDDLENFLVVKPDQQRLNSIRDFNTARCLTTPITEFSHDGQTQTVWGLDILQQIDDDTQAYTGLRHLTGEPISAGSKEFHHYSTKYPRIYPGHESRPHSFPKGSQFNLLPQSAIRTCLEQLIELGLVEAQMTTLYIIGRKCRLFMTDLGRTALGKFRPEIQKREAALQREATIMADAMERTWDRQREHLQQASIPPMQGSPPKS